MTRKRKIERLTAEACMRFGFRWGPVDVARICDDHRGRMFDIVTDHRRLTVWVSRGGRRVRVYDETGAELKRATRAPGSKP